MANFMGNRNVNVTITTQPRFQFGFLNKIILVTDDVEAAGLKISGEDPKGDLATAGITELTSPKLYKAVDIAVGQIDISGNPIVPEYLYVIGEDFSDAGTPVTLAQKVADYYEEEDIDFYYIVPLFYDVAFSEPMILTQNSKRLYQVIYSETQTPTFPDTMKSIRVHGYYDDKPDAKEQYTNVAATGYVGQYDEHISWVFKKLAGIKTANLTDAAVSTLEDNGLNGYRSVRKRGETTGQICTDGVARAEEIQIRDNIVFNVAGAVSDLFQQLEIFPMDNQGRALLESGISAALDFVGSKGLITTYEDGSYVYDVYVPPLTSQMRIDREFKDVVFTYVPRYSAEKVTITGKELLDENLVAIPR